MMKILPNFKKKLHRINAQLFFFALLCILVPITNVLAQTFSYTGAVQSVTLSPGSYQIQMWGANGGDANGGTGGKGGYSAGTLTVTNTATYYIYVGGKGVTANTSTNGGWNGGGSMLGTHTSGYNGGTGGGGTDIRTTQNTNYNDRIIVAGGGGGATGYSNYTGNGGHGGGLTGQNGGSSRGATYAGGAGTQTAGGAGATGGIATYNSAGLLGVGGNYTANGTLGGSAGGGGYYGGGGGHWGGAGGGGSSYIGGVTNGETFMFGDVGFIPNPDASGNGHVIITSNVCSGAPDGGAATALVDSVDCNQPGTVELSGFSNMPGVSHIWEYSLDRITWVPTTNTTTNYIHPSLNTTTYFRAQVTCANSGMSSYSYMDSIVVNSMPINWNTDTVICAGQSYVLDPNVNGTSYVWNTGASTPTITVNAPGTYSVTVTMPDGCISRGSQNVTSVPYPSGDFSYTQIGFSEYQFVSRVQNTDLVEWEFGDGTPNQTGTTVTHLFTTPGIYIVKMYARNACGVADVSAIGIDVKGTSLQQVLYENGLSIFPNPVKNTLIVENSKLANIDEISILDITGRVLVDNKPTSIEHTYKLAVENLPASQYILKLNVNGTTVYSRFVKE